MRSKIRLTAVIAMVLVSVFAGVSFAAYAHTISGMYEGIYEDSEKGVNLPDAWVEKPSGTWDGATSETLCEEISNNWPQESALLLNECEPRLRLDGTMFRSSIDEDGTEAEILVPAVWHGIDEGFVDRVWMPANECCSGRLASGSSEIVIDSRAAIGMNISLDDNISIGAGAGRMEFTVVGIGLQSNHLYFAQDGSLFPAEAGTLAIGYLSSTGLERLANLSHGSSNLLLIDVLGTPDYNLPTTDKDDGPEMSALLENIDETVSQNVDSTSLVYDRSQVFSVEILRADAESAMQFYLPVTGMIAAIAGITIFLSLQRLVQAQSREIAILRTLGVSRSAIMPAYVLMPLAIGVIGSSLGAFLGVFVGTPWMLEYYEYFIGIPIPEATDFVPIVLQIVPATIVVVLLSGVLPAIQASRLQPLEVMRGQHEVRISSRGVQKFTARLPATMGLTIRSSIRKPARLAFTFFAVGLSMLLFGSIVLMMSTMEELTVGSVEDDQNWDIQAYVLSGGEGEVIQWSEEKGASYEKIITFPVNPIGDSRIITAYGMDTLSTNSDAFFVLDLKEGQLPVEGRNTTQILIDEGINHFLGWEVGQTHALTFGSTSESVEVVGITQGEISRTVYFHRSDLSVLAGTDATAVLIDLPDGVTTDSRLGNISLAVIDKDDLASSYEKILEAQQNFMGAILFLGILIAIVVLFNTLIINLSERDREIATLRVLGAPMNRLGWMMFWEHLAIGLIGGTLAFLLTLVGTQAMIASFVQWSFYMSITANPLVAIQLIGIVTFISVILTPYGMRRIRKMDLVEKVKDLSQ